MQTISAPLHGEIRSANFAAGSLDQRST